MEVPPELLVPPEAYGRGFCPHDAALVLDGWLRRLAAQDARGRLVLGRLARAFLRRHGPSRARLRPARRLQPGTDWPLRARAPEPRDRERAPRAPPAAPGGVRRARLERHPRGAPR